MKKKIIIISVVLIGFVMVLTANSWAQRESIGKRQGDRSNHFQKWDKPANQKFNRGQHYRAPQRFGPKFRFLRHRPTNRHVYPKRFFWRHRHSAENHTTNYYSTAESYALPEEAFMASAAVSDSGFSISVGVSKTD